MSSNELRTLLDRCVAHHGHFCLGQVLGVRLAVKGLELVAVDSPKDLIVIVENDRCIADAVQIVTGTRLGRRSMKLVDYGKMAATFIDLRTGKAFRVNVRKVGPPAPGEDRRDAVMEAEDNELLAWREVTVSFKPEELPGKPRRTVACAACGERVFDSKEVAGPAGPLCKACARGAYYETIE